MSSIRFFSFPAIMLGAAWLAAAQNATVTIAQAPSVVMVNAQLQLAATVTDQDGTPLDPSGIQWSSSDGAIAGVSAQGMVSGLAMGDVSITSTDGRTGAAASTAIHVVPSSISIQASPSQIHAGEGSQISAIAYDAAAQPIPGVTFQFRSGDNAIATVDQHGIVTGAAEGFTTIEAAVTAATRNPALVATTQFQVLPAAAFTLKKLISTDVTSATTIASYSAVSAETPTEIGSIVNLANGGQAAILLEGAQIKVLAVVGQMLPNAGRLALRLDAISTNSKGDVALLVQYPSQWCAATVILFPHGKPERELGVANCGNGIRSHSLGEDGSVILRNGDQIFRASSTGVPQLLFSLATQPASSDPIQSVNDVYPSAAGTFIVNASLKSGAHVYLWSEGKTLTRVYKDGDPIRGVASSNLDIPVGTADGSFYARVNGPNFSGLQQLAPGAPKTLLMPKDPITGGTLGWIQNVTDAGAGGVLLTADLNTATYHTAIAVWKDSTLSEYAPVQGYAAMISGAILTNGSPVFLSFLTGDTGAPGIRSLASAGAVPSVLLAAGVPFPQPAPAGIDWHYSARGANVAGTPFRGAGDSIVTAKNGSVQTLFGLGSALPNGKPATWIGAVIANQSGDLVFTAGYPTGNMLVRYRAGKLESLGDTAVTGTGPGGASLSYLYNYRGRFLAMNTRGDVVSVANYSNNAAQVVLNSSTLVARQGAASPAGPVYSSFGNLALDDNGHVVFVATTSDGVVAAYYWDGTGVRRLVAVGDSDPSGFTVNEISNVAGAGSSFVVMVALGNYQLRQLRSFDGRQFTTIEASASSAFDGAPLIYYWMNECTVAGNGDVHCQAQTQDNVTGVYAHRPDGTDRIVARTRDQLPGGEWLIMPLVVASSASGEVFFTAHVYLNGQESLAFYQAVPK